MTRIEIPYPKQLLAIWKIASRGSTRFDTHYIRVDFTSGTLEATDGRAIVRQGFTSSDEVMPFGVVYFSRDDLRRISKIIDGRRLRFVLANDGHDWFAEGLSTGGAHIRVYISVGVDVRWPNTDVIYGSSPAAKSVEFLLAQDVLRRICAIAAETFEESLAFRIPLDGKTPFASVVIGDNEGSARLSFMLKDGCRHPVEIIENEEPQSSNDPETLKDCTK